MEAKSPTGGHWRQSGPPPIESIVEWIIEFAESVRALRLVNRVGDQGWPLISKCWGENS